MIQIQIWKILATVIDSNLTQNELSVKHFVSHEKDYGIIPETSSRQPLKVLSVGESIQCQLFSRHTESYGIGK